MEISLKNPAAVRLIQVSLYMYFLWEFEPWSHFISRLSMIVIWAFVLDIVWRYFVQSKNGRKLKRLESLALPLFRPIFKFQPDEFQEEC